MSDMTTFTKDEFSQDDFGSESLLRLLDDQPEPVLISGESLLWQIQPRLDLATLRLSIVDLVRQHASLSQRVAADDDVVSIDGASLEADFQSVDVRSRSELAGLVRDALAAPFSAGESVLRVKHFVLGTAAHLLLITAHPAIADGWSKGLIVEDLAHHYRRRMASKGAEVAPQPVGSMDDLFPARDESTIAFWRERFPFGVTFPDLPRDVMSAPPDGSANKTDGHHVHSVVVDPASLAAARTLSSQSGVSLSSLVLSAFAGVIARASNADDVTIGLIAAGQLIDGTPRLIAQRTMVLPIRVPVEATGSFLSLAKATQSAVLEAFEHPTHGILDALSGSPQDNHVAAQARISFNFDPSLDQPSNQLGDATGHVVLLPALNKGCDLHVAVSEFGADGLRIDVYVNARSFLKSTATRWAQMVRALFAQAVAKPDEPLSAQSLVLPDDLAQLNRWNGTIADYPSVESVDALVEAQVARTPEASAVEFEGQSITYRALNEQANQLARYLQQHCVARNERVAICVNRGIPMVVALLATLKAGAAYLPLDPAYPEDRLAYMVRHGTPKVLLTEAALMSRIGTIPPEVHVVDLLTSGAAWQGEDAGNISQERQSEDLAYVIYTSGSTGEPKGVAMPHRALVNLLHWQLAEPGFMSLSRTAQFAALGFDVAFQEVFSTLSSGGTLVLMREETRLDAEALFQFVRTQKIERLFVPFVALQVLGEGFALAQARAGQAGISGLCLREVITAGEQLRIEPRISALFEAVPGCRLINHYGPTESHVVTAYWLPEQVSDWPALPPIGTPISNSQIYVLDAMLRPTPMGVAGELYIGGMCLAQGYLNRPDITRERFVFDPFESRPALQSLARMYKTGDMARWRTDGQIEYLGRNDFQVKIRGFRVELGEVESKVAAFSAVKDAVVIAREDVPGVKRLVAYVTPTAGARIEVEALRRFVADSLPEYMVPSAIVVLDRLPLTPNGKLDRRGLPAPSSARPSISTPFMEPVGDVERAISAAFAAVLGIDEVGRHDNFFELGGNSLLAMRALEQLRAKVGAAVTAPMIFAQPTAASLALELAQPTTPSDSSRRASSSRRSGSADDRAIAIVGMAGRFPGAASVEAFWANVLANRDTVTRLQPHELDPSIPQSLRGDPNYVLARGLIDDVENFDAAFFGINAREAEVTDPQHRIFLELCWECLERAGYAPNAVEHSVGVFAGVHSTGYLQKHVLTNPEAVERVGDFQVMVGNEKDYVATRVAYKLNLNGPAATVQTACSTSLVAIIQAVEQLRAGECDMALAGAAAVSAPYRSGYLYEEGAMLSRDGATRTFDESASGTVFSDGAAVVLLKRLSDALEDDDQIYAVIRGVGINNDGGGKASFTAPSARGQAVAIQRAMEDANVSAEQVSYVEAHGTATPLGDPVEIEGLTRAFRARSDGALAKGRCSIGSVKSNIGHLVAAAGAAGVIKTALALTNEVIPASIHYSAANPKIQLGDSPFMVATENMPWARSGAARYAGVSSFGVGGTNAHIVLQEPPQRSPTAPAQHPNPQALRLSARTATALVRVAEDLAKHLEAHPELQMADVAKTLDQGRARHQHRLAIAVESLSDAASALRAANAPHRFARVVPSAAPDVVFVFPGQGSQYAGMGRELYANDATFRAAFDRAIAAVKSAGRDGFDKVIFEGSDESLVATEITQPAIFCIQYSLAQMWLARGLKPHAMIGHSIGEYAAAAIAGVMSLEDAAMLVVQRGKLLQAQAAGGMLSVRAAAEQIEALLPNEVCLAAENGPTACVVAGPRQHLEAFAEVLAKREIVSKPLHTSHAFHSAMMDPAVPLFRQCVAAVKLSPPRIPMISCVTGKLLGDEQAVSPDYWASHLRLPVRFSPAIKSAIAEVEAVRRSVCLLEIGPRASLAALLRQHVGRDAGHSVLSSSADEPRKEQLAFAAATASLWTMGIELTDTNSRAARRVLLPTYPFERKRFWLEARPVGPNSTAMPPAVDALPIPIGPSVLFAPHATTEFALPESASSSSTLSSVLEHSAMSTIQLSASRKASLVEKIRTLFEEVSGQDLASASPEASFLELGLDSLTLTQAAIQLKKSFKQNITFRQLMEQFRSMGSLADHMDTVLPPEPVTTPIAVGNPASAAVASPVTTMAPLQAMAPMPVSMPVAMSVPVGAMPPQGASGNMLQSLIQQQMHLMSQQLALLSGHAAAGMMSTVAQGSVVAASVAPAAMVPTAQPVPTAQVNAAQDTETESKAPQKYDVKKAFGAIARIHTTGNALTDRQLARLDAFVRRYTEKTAKSKEYTVAHRAHLADPRVVNNFRPQTKEIIYQIVMEKSKGSHLWDLDGNKYVDALNGFGMSLFGWQPDFIEEAIRAQHEAGYDVGPMSPLAGEVAKLVCELTGFDRAGFCNTGSEAVMAAIRIARTVTGRSLMVVFAGSYHGTFDEVIVRAGRNNKGIPAAPGIMSEAFGNVLVLEYGTPETLEIIRQHADELAAVLVEPVQSRRADFQPKEFLRDVRAITEKSGTCLIFDEVITGFRSHPGGVQSLFGIRADLGTYGKVVGGGYPIGVIAGKREFMDALDGGAWQYGDDSIPTVGVTYFAGTFVRHPLALAAAKASLLHMKEVGPDLQAGLNLRTAAMADELNAFCAEVGAPITIKNFASLWRTTFTEDHPLQDLLFAMMRSRGVHILDNFPCFFTTAHTPEDVAVIKTAFKESVLELQEADLLPRRNPEAGKVLDASKPPVPGARIGKDPEGNPAWFVPNPASPGKFLRLDA